jgi:hypothetical protein
MPTEKRFASLKDFYPFYLTEHSDFVCRTLHFVGTGLVICLGIAGIITLDWRFFVMMPIAGYGFAWVGHFFFEKNKPAAFANPFYSLAADFMMFFHIISFQLPKKMAESKKLYP